MSTGVTLIIVAALFAVLIWLIVRMVRGSKSE
jgi:flagellar biogenesis protein FliO